MIKYDMDELDCIVQVGNNVPNGAYSALLKEAMAGRS